MTDTIKGHQHGDSLSLSFIHHAINLIASRRLSPENERYVAESVEQAITTLRARNALARAASSSSKS